jgi:hypothetical protein
VLVTYVVFEEVQNPGRKTRVWDVKSTRGAFLGQIRWYARWRLYTFRPTPTSTFSAGCLHDIERFFEREMASRQLIAV